ncbi:SDR family NAD(P)-dependent oxidoreductase [Maricaulis salignorans]|uniref:NADP-dependent 3-hydroxy acid dehydrogenase YdfG n=1 Tax=Maricaulis salignorans TaxID=144026 RepID=A0A1G9T9A4_9PROT|nr:SDR family NAD(P)-dependent oxidoreductase [Maricaulis salignorans]SDM43685.1 NADP-dependent 3-hydroxy acid dehydrogenase YdfG [Maricaulis salignorans]
MTQRNASIAIVGAGDFIGAAIARRFAAEGYHVHGGRRRGEMLAPVGQEIEAGGGRFTGHSLDARDEKSVTAFLDAAEASAPLEAVIFNVGANVQFPLLETSERVFSKVWDMACKAGFLTGREAARIMLPRGAGSIFFTGATASMRGGKGYAAFGAAKAGLRSLAQSMARELGPQGLHVAHLVIDAGVDTAWVRERIAQAKGAEALAAMPPDTLMDPASIAETYLMLHRQSRDAWTHELDLRPYGENW